MSDRGTNRRKLVVGNWKMNGTRSNLSEVTLIAQAARDLGKAEALLCLPGPLILAAKDFGLPLGGQDCSAELEGAFTGDQSAILLADVGAKAVIVGHSERRALHKETNDLIASKARAAWSAGLSAIVCIGETTEERENGETLDVLTDQLANSLPDTANAQNTIVAYEPVWAIGSGKTATPSDIETAHAHIRKHLQNRFPTGAKMSLLYGGSLNASNATQIFSVANVDGGLIGGASLTASTFIPIMRALDAGA